MPAYQLQIKQVVDYPRCRIYRQFVHRLISGAAKGAAAAGPYGAVAGAVWAGRKHIGKIIAVIAILLLLPVLFLLMLDRRCPRAFLRGR